MELLPRAVLAVGITGHRDLGANPNTPVIAATLDTLFANLSRAVRTVKIGHNQTWTFRFFQPHPTENLVESFGVLS